VCRGQLCARLEHDRGDDNLTPTLVWPADDAGVLDRRRFEQDALDLGGIDVLAARDDQFSLARGDEEISVVVEMPDIAGPVPAVLEGFARALRRVPVSGHHVRTAHENLAIAPGWQLAPFAVHDSQFAMQC